MPTVNEQIFDKTVGHAVELQRLAAGTVQQMLRRLAASDRMIFVHIRAWLGRQPVDKLLKAIHRINEKTYAQIGKEMADHLSELAHYEVDFTRKLTERVLPLKLGIAKPKAAQVYAIVDEEPMQGGLLTEWVEGMAEGHYTRIRTAIRMGLQQNESAEQIIARINGRKSQNYRDGLAQTSRRSINSVFGSFYNSVANKARKTLYDENDYLVETMVWSAVMDDVTCEICSALDGQIFSEDDIPELPHLNCRCMWFPALKAWHKLDIEDELDDVDKDALDGKVPDRLTYDKWLQSQSRDKQDELLGPTRARMFRGGLSVRKFVDNSGKRLTLAQLRERERDELQPKTKPPSYTATTTLRTYGWKPDLPDRRDFLFGVSNPDEIALPVRVSLRDKMPPVFNQKSLGSCTAQALIAAAMFAFGPKTPMLSALDLYYKSRLLEDSVDYDNGAALRDAIKAFAKWGVATEATWPYKIRSYNVAPSEEAAKEDDQYRINKYERLKSGEDFRKCLALGHPFVIGVSLFENFDDPPAEKKGVLDVPHVTQRMVGGHAVCVIGFDTDFYNNPVFLKSGLEKAQAAPIMYEVRNSFGSDWGEIGHIWMPAEYLEDKNLADDAWMVVA